MAAPQGAASASVIDVDRYPACARACVHLQPRVCAGLRVSIIDEAFGQDIEGIMTTNGEGPRKVLKRLGGQLQTNEEREAWRKKSRVAAILGSCPRSRPSVKSGCGSWLEYVVTVHGADATEDMAFPPKMNDLLGWSLLFRCPATFCNYLSYVRKMCQLRDVPGPPTDDARLKAAILAISKRGEFTPRRKFFVDREKVANIVGLAERHLADMDFAMLALFTYAFLLRLPSEVRVLSRGANPPIRIHCVYARPSAPAGWHPMLQKQPENRPSSGKKISVCASGCCAARIYPMVAAPFAASVAAAKNRARSAGCVLYTRSGPTSRASRPGPGRGQFSPETRPTPNFAQSLER